MTKVEHFSIGGLALPESTRISLGPRHPSESGALGLKLTLQGDQIIAADVQPGYFHRGAEKLFEVRDYRAAIMLADRHDWLSSFTGESVVATAIEQAMGLNPPPRATWLRALLAEYMRIHSHLSYLSFLDDAVWPVVEEMKQGVLSWSGNRVHLMVNRVGGLVSDMPDGWSDQALATVDRAAVAVDNMERHVPTTLAGLGTASAQTCRRFGVSGPIARAAGLDLDRRKGNSAYTEVYEPTPLRSAGDAYTRFQVLMDEVRTSRTMIRRLLDGLPDGPVNVKLSRRLKVPEGEHIAEVEAPWGIAGTLLVSRGGQTPWRLALRTPTFANVSMLGELLTGHRVDDISPIVASTGYSIGDLDK